MKISAVIITKNEENNIEKSIKSVSFCDEIIIIDDFSTDKTIAIAKKNGAIVYQRKLDDNFAEQRNYGLEKAKGDWILFIDADEQMTYELEMEIKKIIINKNISAYYIKRRDKWWGRWLKYGELFRVYYSGLPRLVRKNSGRWEGKVHERYITLGPTLKLDSFLNHYPHQDVKTFLKDINIYSSIRAKELYDNGIKCTIFAVIFYPFIKFIVGYFLCLGFLDGPPGFAYAFLMSFHSFLVRAKLYQNWNLQKQEYVS